MNLTKVGIHQPESFPWAGYFNKMMNSDLFVILDDVQYKKNNFQNRNRIMMNGRPTWLTIPVNTKNRLSSTIKDTKIADTVDWRARSIHLLEVAYKDCEYYDTVMPGISGVLELPIEDLSVFNVVFIDYIKYYLGIDTPIVYSSDLNISSHKTDLVFDICKACEATTYLSGEGGRDYLELTRFNEDGIEVLYQSFDKDIAYKNMQEPYMSVIDIIMNNSVEESLDYIRNAFKFTV